MKTTERTPPRIQYQDLQFWMNQAADCRIAINAAISKYGSTPAQEAASEALTVAISEYRRRMHDLSVEAREG